MKGLEITVTPQVQRFASDALEDLASLNVHFSDLVQDLRRDLEAVVAGTVQTTTAVQEGPRGFILRGQENVTHWVRLSGNRHKML